MLQQEEAAAGTALDPAVDLDAMSYVQQRKQASDSDLDRLAEGLKVGFPFTIQP